MLYRNSHHSFWYSNVRTKSGCYVDLDCLVIPDKCVGLPTLAALEQGISVIAVKGNKTYQDNEYKKQKITARKVTLNKIRMVVKTTKIRINAE